MITRKHRWHMMYRHLMKNDMKTMNCSQVKILPESLFEWRNVDEIL